MRKLRDKEKSSVDRLRDGPGSVKVETPDDNSNITGMVSFGGTLYAIKEKGVYRIKMADEIDPERRNINVPNTVQRVLPYGSTDDSAGRVFLTGIELLKQDILSADIDADYAMGVVLGIAQSISGAREVAQSIESSEKNLIEQYDLEIREDRSVVLPSLVGISNKCKEFLQKSDHALTGLWTLANLFYPDIKKGMWDALEEAVKREEDSPDNFVEVLENDSDFRKFVRNARNCVEHPREDHRVIVRDFTLDSDNNLAAPSIEVIHSISPQSLVPVVRLFSSITDALVGFIEVSLACLCNRKIRDSIGIPVAVHEFPLASRMNPNVKFGYGVATRDGLIRFG